MLLPFLERKIMDRKKEAEKKFLVMACATLIFFITMISIIIGTNKKEEPGNSEIVDSREVGYGFIYYDGDFYYKHNNLAIIDKSLVGDKVGTTSIHLKHPLIDDTKFEDTGETAGFALYEGTDFYSYNDRDDVLLVESEYALFGYYVYVKDKTVSDMAERNSIEHYKDWPLKVISYGLKEIPMDIKLSDFSQTEEALTMFPSTSLDDGAITYYVLIEDDGLYSTFEGLGNVLSDYIALTSMENGKQAYFIHKYEGLSKVLIDMYGDFFGFKEVEEMTPENPGQEPSEELFPENDDDMILNPLPES